MPSATTVAAALSFAVVSAQWFLPKTNSTAVVRQALGYEKIHVAGHSAGGSSVFTQARYFPAAVKSVIAEAPWPTWTRNRWPLDEYYASRTAYAQLLSPYVGQVLNGHEFSLLDIDRAQKVLDKKPYTFKWNGKTAQFDGAALMHRLYVDFPDDPKPLAAFLAAIANGDRSGLKAFVGEPKEAVIEQGDFPWGLHLASVCGDIGEAKLTKYEALALVKAEPGLLGFESILACPWWSTIGDVPVEHSRPPSLDIPVLVITGEYDTCCGRRIVDEIRPVSPVVQAVDLPGRGHGVMGDCRNEAVRQFLDNPTAPVDVSCLSEE
ncbi:MAG: alpha/beta fold hydrolase [Pseudomonadota bacterium]